VLGGDIGDRINSMNADMSATKVEFRINPSRMTSCSTMRTLRRPRVVSYIWKPVSPWYACATMVVRASRGKAPTFKKASLPSIDMSPALKLKSGASSDLTVVVSPDVQASKYRFAVASEELGCA
jgi:hypothetical protein